MTVTRIELRLRALHRTQAARRAKRRPSPRSCASEDIFFENRTARAVQVASPGRRRIPTADVNLHKVAAWTMVSRVLLNLDETITKE